MLQAWSSSNVMAVPESDFALYRAKLSTSTAAKLRSSSVRLRASRTRPRGEHVVLAISITKPHLKFACYITCTLVMCNAIDGDAAVQSAYDTEVADTTSVKPDAAAAAEMYGTNRLAYLKHKAASHGTAKGAITPVVAAVATHHGSNSSSCADTVHDDGE
jgi:hypothetical protein